MAFEDKTRILYDGEIKLDYKDKAHRYYVRLRIDWDLEVTDKKAWGKVMYPEGTTTLMGDTLEKKGLMQWPKREALKELFGFYESFKTEEGEEVPAGFSKDVGTLWGEDDKLVKLGKKEAVDTINSASTNWQRRQRKGADIGSVVHDAIEHFITDKEFDIGESYAWNIKEFYDSEVDKIEKNLEKDKISLAKATKLRSDLDETDARSREEFDVDVEMAKTAFLEFQKWWLTTKPTLFGAEEILYSKIHNVCGTYDGDLGIPKAFHPMAHIWKDKDVIRVVADWKTSKAYGDAPEGISYDYFLQDAIYELMRREMDMEPADDLLVVSARKDGGFNTVYASELGLTIDECLEWAKVVIFCYRMRERALNGLKEHAKPKQEVIKKSNVKEAF